MTYVWLFVGLLILIKGADLFVDGAKDLANRLHVPSLIIGLTIVAFGTSAPEASVSFYAASTGFSDISYGNIIGSNIFNITLILGFIALLKPFKIEENLVKREIPFMIFSVMTLIFVFLFLNRTMDMFVGIILLIIFFMFLFYVIKQSLKQSTVSYEKPKMKLMTQILWIALGLSGVIFGGRLFTSQASLIALSWGMSELVIGLTVVAIGTSLPEFVTSVVAMIKGSTGLAIGNIIGSNIFNIFFILGLSTVIQPMVFPQTALIDFIFLTMISVLVLIFSITGFKLTKKEGIVLMFCFLIYMIYMITT